MEAPKLKKVLFIYFLTYNNEWTEEFESDCLKQFEVDNVILLKADNELQHTQYPYFTVQEFEV